MNNSVFRLLPAFLFIGLVTLSGPISNTSGANTSGSTPNESKNTFTLIRQDTVPTPTGDAFVQFTPQDKYLATKGVNIALYDTSTYQLKRRLSGTNGQGEMAFSQDNELVAVGAGFIKTRTIGFPIPYLWTSYVTSYGWVDVLDTKTGEVVTQIKNDPRLFLWFDNPFAWGHRTRVQTVDFSSTDNLVVSGTKDLADASRVILSNTETGEMLASVPGEKAKFFPSGNKVLVWSRKDTEWTVWKLDKLIEAGYGVNSFWRPEGCCENWPGFIKRLDGKGAKKVKGDYERYQYKPFFKQDGSLGFLRFLEGNPELQEIDPKSMQIIKRFDHLKNPINVDHPKYPAESPLRSKFERYKFLKFLPKRNLVLATAYLTKSPPRFFMWNYNSGELAFDAFKDELYALFPKNFTENESTIIFNRRWSDEMEYDFKQLEVYELKRK